MPIMLPQVLSLSLLGLVPLNQEYSSWDEDIVTFMKPCYVGNLWQAPGPPVLFGNNLAGPCDPQRPYVPFPVVDVVGISKDELESRKSVTLGSNLSMVEIEVPSKAGKPRLVPVGAIARTHFVEQSFDPKEELPDQFQTRFRALTVCKATNVPKDEIALQSQRCVQVSPTSTTSLEPNVYIDWLSDQYLDDDRDIDSPIDFGLADEVGNALTNTTLSCKSF
jgi:hypothetical protein